MGRMFSLSTVLRYIPKVALGKFFTRQGYGNNEIPWERLQPGEIEPILHHLESLPRSGQDRLEHELHEVWQLASPTGLEALKEIGKSYWSRQAIEEFHSETGYYGKAMHAYLSYNDVFCQAIRIYEIDHVNCWRKRDDLPKKAANKSAATKTELAARISELIVREQGRGKHCSVDVLSRGELDYFIVHPDDHVTDFTTHDDEGKLKPSTIRPTFLIIFAYNATAGTLELCTAPLKLDRFLADFNE